MNNNSMINFDICTEASYGCFLYTVFKTCMLLSQDHRIKSQVSEGHETCLKLYDLSSFKRYEVLLKI